MAEFSTTILARFETTGLNEAADQLSDADRELEAFGKSLVKTVNPTHALRRGVEEITDKLKLMGFRGNQVATQINRMVDPMERMKYAQKAFADMTTYSTSRLGRFNDDISRLGAKLEMLKAKIGPVGMSLLTAFGAAAVASIMAVAYAIGRVAVDAVKAFAEKNEEAKKEIEGLVKALDALQLKLGEALYVSGKLSDILLGIAELIERKIIPNWDRWTDGIMKVLGFLDRIKVGFAGIGISILEMVPVLGQVVMLAKDLHRHLAPLAEKRRAREEAYEKLDKELKEIEKEGPKYAGYYPLGYGLPEGWPFPPWVRETEKFTKALEGAKNAIDGITAAFERINPLRWPLHWGLAMGAAMPPGVGLAKKVAGIAEERAVARKPAIEEAYKAAMGKVEKATKEATVAMNEFWRSFLDRAVANQWLMTINDMASAFGEFVFAIASGRDAWDQFLGAALQALGKIAIYWGNFLLMYGLGVTPIIGLNIGAGAAIAAGTGLIALGAGLQFAGGLVSKGGGGGGGGARGTPTSAVTDLTRDIFGPRGQEPQDVQVSVYVMGDQVRDPIYEVIRRGQRLGHLRFT